MAHIGELISAAQVVGKTLMAKEKVPVYRKASNSEPPYGYVTPGSPVGIVYSWVDPNGTSRTTLWWMFNDANGVPYYTPHIGTRFDVSALKEQGAVTVSDQVAAEQKAKDKLEMSPVEYYLKYYGKYLLGGVVAVAAAPAIIKGIFSKF